MAKTPWWKWLLMALKIVAKEVEDGSIGAGKKTAKAGQVAGQVLDEVSKETNP